MNRVQWEIPAALSAATFAERYARECCRHTEAVADCPHCNLNFIAAWVRRAAEILQATGEPPSVAAVDPVAVSHPSGPRAIDPETSLAVGGVRPGGPRGDTKEQEEKTD